MIVSLKTLPRKTQLGYKLGKEKRVQSFCDELQILQTYKVIQLQIQCQK